jgi:hypothetical protein
MFNEFEMNEEERRDYNVALMRQTIVSINNLPEEDRDRVTKEIEENVSSYNQMIDHDPRESAAKIVRSAYARVQSKGSGDDAADSYASWVGIQNNWSKAETEKWIRKALAEDRIVDKRFIP